MTPGVHDSPGFRPELVPAVDATFAGHQSSAGEILVCGGLVDLARHAFTTRNLWFRGSRVEEDYERIAGVFGVASTAVVRVRQVHEASVLEVQPGVPTEASPEADAVVCLDPARVVSVRIADCVPVLMADRGGRLVAAVHAGWRGTAAGVVAAAVRAAGRHGVRPTDLVAAIGPSAAPCCYQVDAAVRRRFDGVAGSDGWFVPDGDRRWRIDLAAANRAQLVAVGVPADAVHAAGQCTIHEARRWHSHRRDGEAAGRMVAAIRLGTRPRGPLADVRG